MTVTVARWTLADYHQMIESGFLQNRHVELLEGLIVEMAPEGPGHAYSLTLLDRLLDRAAQDRYQVREAKPISLPTIDSQPEPDIALVREKSYRKGHPSPEDIFLVVEFSDSSLAKDTETKRLVYAKAGIEEYWIVNLRDRLIVVYRQPQAGDYTVQAEVSTGDLSPVAFPDVTFSVRWLLDS